jgi:flagellar basal-body rod protein FlgB
MTLFDTTQLGLERAIQGAAMRQTALSQNVANANTPGYRRVDVDFHAALRDAMERGRGEIEGVQFSQSVDGAAVMRPDGGTVDVDVESANLAKNALDYETLVAAARARIEILKAAMGVQ